MVNRTDLKNAVLGALKRVAPETDPAAIPSKAPLRDELDIDSMDFLKFLLLLKESTGIDVPESDADSLSTIDGAVEYLAGRA
ncbi:MAG TPA: phosphopantetheine-binding protein [bacterium]|nr:phosphopantetheine-binding protein [bacterium]